MPEPEVAEQVPPKEEVAASPTPAATEEVTPAPPPVAAPKTFFKSWNEKEGKIEEYPSELEEPQPPKAEEKPAETKQEEPAPPKKWAGKYESPEKLEEGYQSQSKVLNEALERSRKAEQELAELRSAKQPDTATQIAEQVAEKVPVEQEMVNLLLENPKEFRRRMIQDSADYTLQMITAERDTRDWLEQNKDIADQQHYIAAEMQKILAAKPEMVKDRAALLTEATGNYRQHLGNLRKQVQEEVLTIRREVQPLNASSMTPKVEPTPQPKGAPQGIEPLDDELRRRKAEYARTRGEASVR